MAERRLTRPADSPARTPHAAVPTLTPRARSPTQGAELVVRTGADPLTCQISHPEDGRTVALGQIVGWRALRRGPPQSAFPRFRRTRPCSPLVSSCLEDSEGLMASGKVKRTFPSGQHPKPGSRPLDGDSSGSALPQEPGTTAPASLGGVPTLTRQP